MARDEILVRIAPAPHGDGGLLDDGGMEDRV